MNNTSTIKINFKGGIISPGELYNILIAAGKAGVLRVKFGLRQQLLIETEKPSVLESELDLLGIKYECDKDNFPNIVSSYPAEEVFITNTWLSEGVYKDIFDLVDYQPLLKINVSDSNQSFTPLLTGNINWVASPSAQHFWHLFIRFPKTNVVYEWKDLVYTNDVVKMSKQIETLIFQHRSSFYDNSSVNGDELYSLINTGKYITKPVGNPLQLPSYNLPYYEGLNRYNEKSWLGIYRRDELFSVEFMKEVCLLCLHTKIGQLCSSPWKSIIIKGIEDKDRGKWSSLLAKHQVNVRHAANELNFQIEDNCTEGLELKKFLVRHLSADDIRTFGLCIGIKTRKKTEVFSSILIRRKPVLSIFGAGLFYVYDILCAENFNPNERTGSVFSANNPKFLLPEQLRRAVLSFNMHTKAKIKSAAAKTKSIKKTNSNAGKPVYINQCVHCLTVYEDSIGDPDNGVAAGTSFESLSETFCCPLCEAGKEDFIKIETSKLELKSI